MKTTTRLLFAGAFVAGCVPLAQAHPGHDGHELTWDFQTGFVHPFSGIDHLVGILAVGWWAAQLGGRARWWVSATFLAAMTLGGILGQAVALSIPVLAQAIAVSLLVIGLAVAGAWRMPLVAAAGMAAAFAAFHGLAHAAEMPATARALDYLAGFVAGSAVLLAVGLTSGTAARERGVWTRRFAGAACAAIGCVLLLG